MRLYLVYLEGAHIIALADCAIELIYISAVAEFIGHEQKGPIEVGTDSKAAHDLCHRFTSAQNTSLVL